MSKVGPFLKFFPEKRSKMHKIQNWIASHFVMLGTRLKIKYDSRFSSSQYVMARTFSVAEEKHRTIHESWSYDFLCCLICATNTQLYNAYTHSLTNFDTKNHASDTLFLKGRENLSFFYAPFFMKKICVTSASHPSLISRSSQGFPSYDTIIFTVRWQYIG